MPNRKESISIELQYPFPEDRVFRYQAMQDVLDVLIDQPYATYSMSELANLTEQIKEQSRRRSSCFPSSMSSRLYRTGEPSRSGSTENDSRNRIRFSIPQAEFHQPVRVFLQRLQDKLDELVGVVLFGSVARGSR